MLLEPPLELLELLPELLLEEPVLLELVEELSSDELLSSVEVDLVVVVACRVVCVAADDAVWVEIAIHPARPSVAAPAVATAPRLHCWLRATSRSG